MLKPDLLRAALVSTVPDLERNPEKLSIFIDKGRIASRLGPTPAFEYRYRLNAVLLDYRGHPDSVMIALLLWIRIHQSELLANQGKGENAIVFEADIIDANTIDLSIELELTERVGVTPRLGGGFEAIHFGEPVQSDSFSDAPPAPLREIYDAAGTLLVAAV